MSAFENLPPELVWRVFCCLDATFVVSVLPQVCRKFCNLICNESNWKNFISQRFNVQATFPACQLAEPSFCWKKLAVEFEREHQKWAHADGTLDEFLLTGGHLASVDAVHLMNGGQLALSGSRDRSICVWDLHALSKFDPQSVLKARKQTVQAHKGWIWDITSRKVQGDVFSCSWDRRVTRWQIANGTHLERCEEMRCEAAVLCVVAEPDCVIASTFDHKIKLFDPRDHCAVVASLNYHVRPVIHLAVSDNFIFSCSEDRYVACLDKRTKSVMTMKKMSTFVMSVSYNYGQLWASDCHGNIHLMDPRNGSLDILTSVKLSPQKVNHVLHNQGALITASADKKLRILHPTLQPKVLTTLGPYTTEPSGLAYCGGVLACGFSDYSLGVWKPKNGLILRSD